MKDLKDFLLNESGRYVDYADEDTGEIVTMWVEDPDPEELARKLDMAKDENDEFMAKWEKEREIRKELEPFEDEQWELKDELKDLQYQLRSLRIDQEEEIGQLYAAGKYAEGDELAQKYGTEFNKIEKRVEKIKKRLKKLDDLIEPYYDKIHDLWKDE